MRTSIVLLNISLGETQYRRSKQQLLCRLYSTGYGYTAELNKLAWDIYGACTPPHGTPDEPSTLAAILRHPDLSGMLHRVRAVQHFKHVPVPDHGHLWHACVTPARSWSLSAGYCLQGCRVRTSHWLSATSCAMRG